MRKLLCLFVCWIVNIHGIETDFDTIVVGTSPISMLEAIYQRASGKTVLVVEKAGECGGAWKSITICGIEHADLGCHEYGSDQTVRAFLEDYIGCKIIPNTRDKNMNFGYCPSRGCYELVHNLELLMQKFGVNLLLNSKLESVYLDSSRKIAEVRVNGRRFTTSKIIATNRSEIRIENSQARKDSSNLGKYYHVYMLIEDPTPSRFMYMSFSASGASRAMNLTQFTGLEGTGRQLIAIQVHHEQSLQSGPSYLAALKNQGYVDANACISRVETYVYEQAYFNPGSLQSLGELQSLFEVINTTHIANIRMYLDKWKKSMRPWKEVMG